MKFDRSIVDIRPRRTFEILDLAIHFYRDHLSILVKLAVLFGLPAYVLSMILLVTTGEVWFSVLVFWLLLPLSSGAVILAASRLVFGVSLSVRRVFTLYRRLVFRYFFIRLVHRLLWLPLLALGVVFGELVRLRLAFSPMIILLERLKGQLATKRRQSLGRRGGANALGVDIASLLFCSAVMAALAFVIDLLFSDVLAVWEFGGMFSGLDQSPSKVGLWLVILLAVSPILDLTWFFYYLDARIRKEGWDLELGFRFVANRLRESDKEAM